MDPFARFYFFSILGIFILTPSAVISVTVSDILKEGNFTVFLDELIKNNMTDILNYTGPMTIFAPTNYALTSYMNGDMYKKIGNQPNIMKKVLHCYAVVGQKLDVDKIKNDMTAPSMNGDLLRFNIYGKTMTVNGVAMTVYHPRVALDNIAIYTVNSSLAAGMDQDVVAILQRHPSFSIIVSAIENTGLLETLQGDGPFTIFAPTDDNFKSQFEEGELEKLLVDSDLLKTILMGHVVKGTYFMAGLNNPSELATLDGASNYVFSDGTSLKIDGVNVVQSASDMLGKNGVVHVIDHVLLT